MINVMGSQMVIGFAQEQRDTDRCPWAGGLTYQYGPHDKGTAFCRNISRNGAGIVLGRYLKPGRYVLLTADSPFSGPAPIELKARIMWCRPTGNNSRFNAGVLVYEDDFDAMLAFTWLADHAATVEGNAPATRQTRLSRAE